MTEMEASLLPEDDPHVLYIDYTNWRGVRKWRRVILLNQTPTFIPYDKIGYQDIPIVKAGLLIHVWDLDRKARRSYHVKDMHEIRDTKPEGYDA